MKKLLFKIGIFCAIFLLVDLLIGFGMNYLKANSKGGETRRQHYMITEMEDSILIFGSSRAVHHYNPIQLADSLGTSVYNCGQGGLGILHAYIILSKLLKRYHPSLIIYDLYMPYDYNYESDNSKYLSYQQPFYGDNIESDCIYEVIDCNIKYKMFLNTYRYNSKIFTYLQDFIKPSRTDINGFRPLSGEIDHFFPKPNYQTYTKDPLKWEYFEKFVQLCQIHDIPIFFTISPYYFDIDQATYNPYMEYACQNNIPILNHLDDERFKGQSKLFNDPSHLNSLGATYYTDIITNELDSLLRVL